MSRILITGAAGFIGSHLADACVKAGHQVHVIVRAGSGETRLAHLRDRIVRHCFDLRSDAELRRCLQDVLPEVVFHLAGSPRRLQAPDLADARESIREELDCLISLLATAAATAKPPRCMVRTGSLAEYGSAPAPYREDVRETPVTAHGANVLAGTHYIGALQSRLCFPAATARLALVYGPSQSTDYFIPALVTRCLAGESSLVHRPADRRDLVYIDDVVVALRLMANKSLPPAAIVNIASGIAPAMREVAQFIARNTGASPDLLRFSQNGAPNGAGDLRGSPELAQRLLGWRPGVTLADGLVRTIKWYRDCLAADGYPGSTVEKAECNHA